MSVVTLGLAGAVGHDPAAALFVDNKLVAAIEEERLIRRKHAKGEPLCFSWGRGRDGPCTALVPNPDCKNTPQRKPACEFRCAADLTSTTLPQHPYRPSHS